MSQGLLDCSPSSGPSMQLAIIAGSCGHERLQRGGIEAKPLPCPLNGNSLVNDWSNPSTYMMMYNLVYTCSITCVLALTMDTKYEHDVASSLGRFLCFAVAYNAEEDLGNGSMSRHVHVKVLIHASRCAIVADCFRKLMMKRSWHTYGGKDGW